GRARARRAPQRSLAGPLYLARQNTGRYAKLCPGLEILRGKIFVGIHSARGPFQESEWESRAGMKRALVIDDHEPSRKNLVGVLAESGFQIVGAATSGAAGLQLASASAPDVILMAVGLADLDGLHAARTSMQAHPVPIVLVTSHYDAAAIERAKRAGVLSYLIKPSQEA